MHLLKISFYSIRDELLMYSQKETESPCKEVNGSDRGGLLSSKPIKGYEWVLNLVTNEESPFFMGLNDPMCKAMAGEVIHGCLSDIYRESIKNCTDMDKLTDCVLPNAEDTAAIVAIFSNPVHRSECNNELPSRLLYQMASECQNTYAIRILFLITFQMFILSCFYDKKLNI